MNLILIAPPAAGKGTQAKKISKEYSLPHISTGDLLRDIDDENLKKEIKAGKFVSDELVTTLLKERIKKEDCKNGFILDGYPRSLKQAKLYEDLTKELNLDLGLVLVFDLPKEDAMKRMTGRQSCPKCGAVYNEFVDIIKPKVSGICDNCGESLIKREDDNIETFEKRYQTYEETTKPLIGYYESKGIVRYVKSGITPEDTFKNIKEILGDKND